MTLLSPALLWTLVALLPLAAIYFLKVRPRKKPVTAYFLWQKILTENKASALFKRLRDLVSLLIMALAFAAVALSLAEPDLAGDERKDLLIVVDHSASMSAVEGGKSRLDLARQKARDLIAGLNGTQRAAVASFSDTVTVLAHPTRYRKALLDAVDSVEPTELPSRSEALRALQPGNEWTDRTRVLLITDGCLDASDRLPPLEVVRVGRVAENVGLARADLRPVPGGVSRLGLFLLPVSSYAQEVKTDIRLTHQDSGRLVKVIPVTLPSGASPAITLMLDDAPPGRWTAALGLQDALALDNTVYFFVPPVSPVPVAVQGDDPYFFQNVVQAFERSDQLLTLAGDLLPAKMFLAKGTTTGGTSGVIFQPTGESSLWKELGEEIRSPVPKIVAKDHPLLRYLDAESINFAGARRMKAPAGAVVLVADEDGTPLIHLMREGGETVCVVNLDPLVAQFYLSAWFPVLIHNAAAHLTHREETLPATLATGLRVQVPGISPEGNLKIKSPSGEVLEQTGARVGPLRQTGFYEITTEGGGAVLGCSLVSPEESQLRNEALQDSARPLASGRAPAYWLMVLAVAMVAGESALYHRRKAG